MLLKLKTDWQNMNLFDRHFDPARSHRRQVNKDIHRA